MYPILFEFGPLTVFSLWFFIAVGFIVGALIFASRARRYRVRLTLITDNSFFLFLYTLLTARLIFIIFHPHFFFYQFSFTKLFHLITIWDKGLSLWGGVLGFGLSLLYLGYKNNQSLLRIADIMIPSFLYGMSIGAIGAFLDGINYGTPTSLPWGVIFESANVKYITPIHPTQLYSMVYTLAIGSGLLMLLRSAYAKTPGLIALFGSFAYSTLRFFEEFLRGDETIRLFTIRLPQLLAGLGMFFFGYLIYVHYIKKKPHDSKTAAEKMFFSGS